MGAQNHQAECRVETSGDGCVSLTGPLSFESVPEVYRRLEQNEVSLEQVDLAGVSNADSAGLALLLEWQAQARAADRKLTVANAPGGLLRLARLCDAVELLNLSGRSEDGNDAA